MNDKQIIMTNNKPRIFIGSSTESLKVAEAIKANFEFDDVEVRIWNEDLFLPGQYTLDELIRFTKSFDFGIFVWANDDKVEIQSREISKNQPRDNVILEAGMFYGALGKERVFLFAPTENTPKIPSDLLGLSTLRYKTPTDENYKAELSTGVNKIKNIILKKGIVNKDLESHIPINIFYSLDSAKQKIIEECLIAQEIKILSNKGLEFFGSDSSIISLADIAKYNNIRQLKVILLSPNSRWINRGFMALRQYENIQDFKNEIISTHKILEIGMRKFLKGKKNNGGGIKYHLGEPYFRFVMTENSVFVSTYAENPTTQVRDLPVYHFRKEFGSLYGSLKRHFNDLWKNNSELGETLKEVLDVEISAGGVVFHKNGNNIHIVLVEREDGSWVLPKGHKNKSEKNIEETVLREVNEETNIPIKDLNIIKKIDSYSYDETANKIGVTKLNHFYLLECTSSFLPSLKTDPDHLSAKWWNVLNDLPFLFYSYQKIIISETIKNEFDIETKINPR